MQKKYYRLLSKDARAVRPWIVHHQSQGESHADDCGESAGIETRTLGGPRPQRSSYCSCCSTARSSWCLGRLSRKRWTGSAMVRAKRWRAVWDSSAPSKIVIDLDFFTPFEAHNAAEFTMLPQGNATNVTWL